jgi:membrane fusion protein, multidrug efflux system
MQLIMIMIMIRILIAALLLVSPLHAAKLATIPASYETLPLERWVEGTVEAVNQATVSAETKGRVANIAFDIGDTVLAGEVILTLVPNEQRENLNQAEAKQSEAKANYEVEIKENKRIESLYQKNVISKSDWERAQARVAIYEAQVAAAAAGLKSAQEQLSYTEIRSPYGGIVSARFVELGEAVQPGTPLMSGFNPKLMRVSAAIPQGIAKDIRLLKKAKITTEKGNTFIPNKIILYPVADPETSTITVRLELPEMNVQLYPGEFVKVGFTIGEKPYLLIPKESVVYRSEVSGVYVLNNQILTLRQIRLGNDFGEKIEVLAGLNPGELVAIDPIAAIIDMRTPISKNKGDGS